MIDDQKFHGGCITSGLRVNRPDCWVMVSCQGLCGSGGLNDIRSLRRYGAWAGIGCPIDLKVRVPAPESAAHAIRATSLADPHRMLTQVDDITVKGQLAEVRSGEHNPDSGNSPNESENFITFDRHPAHPGGCSLRCTGRVACHLHSAGSAQPATTCSCRSFSCTRDGQFGSQAVGWGHGYVAGMDWL